MDISPPLKIGAVLPAFKIRPGDGQAITRQRNICVSVRVAESTQASIDDIFRSIHRPRGHAFGTFPLLIGQDHALFDADFSSDPAGPFHPQGFVNLLRTFDYTRGQPFPLNARTAGSWEGTILGLIGFTLERLIVERSCEFRIGAPCGVVVKAFGE